jgi:hypothetical protein
MEWKAASYCSTNSSNKAALYPANRYRASVGGACGIELAGGYYADNYRELRFRF